MDIASTRSIALSGAKGTAVEVEASITNGTPGLHLIGLPDTTRLQARDRVRAAIVNSDEDVPNRHTAISLLPISLPKHGSVFDLAIAVAILAANGAIPPQACTGMALVGELGLDGRVRPVHGVPSAVRAAVDAGITAVVVPQANAAEAAVTPNVDVIGVTSLCALIAQLRAVNARPDSNG